MDYTTDFLEIADEFIEFRNEMSFASGEADVDYEALEDELSEKGSAVINAYKELEEQMHSVLNNGPITQYCLSPNLHGFFTSFHVKYKNNSSVIEPTDLKLLDSTCMTLSLKLKDLDGYDEFVEFLSECADVCDRSFRFADEYPFIEFDHGYIEVFSEFRDTFDANLTRYRDEIAFCIDVAISRFDSKFTRNDFPEIFETESEISSDVAPAISVNCAMK